MRSLLGIRSITPAFLAALAATAPAQVVETWKLQGGLRERVRDAAPGHRLPVYFVMRDRLGYHDWFPRLAGVPLAQRRAIVLREAGEHAACCQRALLAVLRRERDRGTVRDIQCNCIGNFVQARLTIGALARATPLGDVWEVWPDEVPPRQQVEDAAPPSGAGNGPLAVGADRVWAMGFRGQGVVVMNSDSGINVQHRALFNRLWTNPGEIPGNGIDDDGNGFVDDIHGWGFDWNRADIEDNGGHGTSTAGVMVADGTCGTTYGIAPGGLVMTGKLGSEASQWNSIQYALLMGADVQTSSHSYKNDYSPPPNYRVHRDIAEITLAAGLIRTNSTSNNGGVCTNLQFSTRRPFNVSAPGNVPGPYLDPNQTLIGRPGGVIGVGAYDVGTGQLASVSPCGPSAWDLGDLLAVLPTFPLQKWDPADGDYPWNGGAKLGLLKPDVLGPTGTITTVAPGATCAAAPFGGTSNATPAVMGCIMLWKSANMSLGPEDVGMIIHQTSDDYGTVPGKENTYGAGRVDAYAGVLRALAVHRVDGHAAWEVWHQSGTPLNLELDGSAGRPALLVVGMVRQKVSFGAFASGVGSVVWQVAAGTTGASGEALRASIPVPRVGAPVLVYTQAFVDDRKGPSGRILASNVTGVRILP